MSTLKFNRPLPSTNNLPGPSLRDRDRVRSRDTLNQSTKIRLKLFDGPNASPPPGPGQVIWDFNSAISGVTVSLSATFTEEVNIENFGDGTSAILVSNVPVIHTY